MKFVFLLLTALPSLCLAASPLEERLSVYSFTPEAKQAMGSAASVADLAAMRAKPFLQQAAVYHEVQEFLRTRGLHLGMTTEDLNFFRRANRLPYKSAETSIESLGLSFSAMVLADRLGIVALEDAAEVNIREAEISGGASAEVVAELAESLAIAHFPLQGYYLFKARIRSEVTPLTLGALEAFPLTDMGFTSRLTQSLQSHGFQTAADLWRLTKVDFSYVPGLSIDHVRKIDVRLKALGYRLAADALDRAIQSGIPVDTNLSIKRHVYIEHQKGRRMQPVDVLESIGALTIGDLLQLDLHALPDELVYKELMRRVKKAHTDLCQAKLEGN